MTRLVTGGAFNSSGPWSTDGLALYDFVGPSATLTVPVDGARYRQGDTIAAAFECPDPDGPLDITSCSGNVPSGSVIDTATPGTKTFTVTATDSVGNSATKTVSYEVVNPSAAALVPVIGSFTIKPAKFKANKGATVSFKLSTASTVNFTITRKSGKKTVKVKTFNFKGKAGANKLKLTAQLKGKAAKPGSYQLVIQAKGPTGLTSKKTAKAYKIVR